MINNIIIYALAFTGIWIGAGLALESVEKLAKKLKTSSFILSFLLLGLLTSISEVSVGINAIINNDPEIYVGNLIGASIVITMLIVPLLAITGNKINISKKFQGINLPISLVTISLPVILSLDQKISLTDSFISIVFFILLIITLQSKKNLLTKIADIKNNHHKTNLAKEFFKIFIGIILVFIASKFVVEQTIYFAHLINVSPFLLSLLVVSIGTNIPEISFVIRSAFMKNNQIAFGNYLGSASFNTFFLGFLTLINGNSVSLSSNYLSSLLFLIVGLILFYIFARSKNSISQKEGLIILSIYILFVISEIIIYKL